MGKIVQQLLNFWIWEQRKKDPKFLGIFKILFYGNTGDASSVFRMYCVAKFCQAVCSLILNYHLYFIININKAVCHDNFFCIAQASWLAVIIRIQAEVLTTSACLKSRSGAIVRIQLAVSLTSTALSTSSTAHHSRPKTMAVGIYYRTTRHAQRATCQPGPA